MAKRVDQDAIDYVQQRTGMTFAGFQAYVTRTLPGRPEIDRLWMRDRATLKLDARGWNDEGGNELWTMPCDIVEEDALARDRGVFFRVAELGSTMGRVLLRNFVDTTKLFGVSQIPSCPLTPG